MVLGNLQANMNRQGISTAQKGCCNACNKPIVGQVITALGRTWHPEHFTCNHCMQELGTRNFFERDGFPYCETDYHNLFSPRCAYCNGAILDVRSNARSISDRENNNRFSYISFLNRNASPLWTKHGTQNISSVPNAVNNSAKKDSMNAMANHTAATTTLKCLHQNAVAAIVPSWKTTFQRWTLNGIQTASSAE